MANGGQEANVHDRLTGRQALALHALGALLVCLPILLSDTPPLVDFPKHIAAVHIGATTHDPALANPNYVYSARWMPYLGLELSLLPLMALLEPVTAGRVLLAAIVTTTGAAPAVLHRAVYGRWHAWPWLGYLLAYHHMVFWGFLNYLVAVPATVLAFSTWVAWRDRPPWMLASAMSLWAFVLLTIHLYAWGVLGLFLLGHTLRRLRDGVILPLLWDAVPFIVSAAGAAMLVEPGSSKGFSNPDAPWVTYGTVGERVRDLISPVNFDYLPSDGLVAILCGLLLYGAIRDGTIRVHEDLVWPSGALLVGVFLMPVSIMGAWSTMRLPTALALVCVGASLPRGIPAVQLRRIGTVAVLAVAFRSAELTTRWRACDQVISEVRTILGDLPKGSGWSTVLHPGAEPRCLQLPMLSHVTAYGIVDRRGYSPAVRAYGPVAPTPHRAPVEALGDPLHPAVLSDPDVRAILSVHTEALVHLHVGTSALTPPSGWRTSSVGEGVVLWVPEDAPAAGND